MQKKDHSLGVRDHWGGFLQKRVSGCVWDPCTTCLLLGSYLKISRLPRSVGNTPCSCEHALPIRLISLPQYNIALSRVDLPWWDFDCAVLLVAAPSLFLAMPRPCRLIGTGQVLIRKQRKKRTCSGYFTRRETSWCLQSTKVPHVWSAITRLWGHSSSIPAAAYRKKPIRYFPFLLKKQSQTKL